MKSRQVSFYVEREHLTLVMTTVVEEVVPRFEQLPHFLGLTVIKSDVVDRSEVVATSYWDDGLEGSETESQRFVDEIIRVTGSNPSRKSFDILYARVRDSTGHLCSA